MEIDGFVEHFDENQFTYIESEKKDLLEKFVGYIVYRVKKQYPEKDALYGKFTKEFYIPSG